MLYCSVCGRPLGNWYDEDLSKDFKPFCPYCSQELEIVDTSTAIRYLDSEWKLTYQVFRDYLSTKDIFRYLILFLNLRESWGITDFSQRVPSGMEKTSFKNFIVFTYILPIILNVMRDGFIPNMEQYLETDDIISDQGYELYRLYVQQKYIEEDLGLLVKKGKSYKFIVFEIINQFHLTFRRFGFLGGDSLDGESLQNVENHILSRYQQIGNHVLDWMPYYLLALMTISFPDSKIRQFSFPKLRDLDCAFLDRFIGYITKAIEGRCAKSLSELTKDKWFFALVPKDEVIAILSRGKQEILDGMRQEPTIPQKFIQNFEQLNVNRLLEIITSSPEIPQRYPIVVEASGKLAIGPYTLVMTSHLLSAKYKRKQMKKILNNFAEPKFEEEILEILHQNKINLEDDGSPPIRLLKIEKKGVFEIDILGRKDDKLFVFELKSFDPHPYFFTKKERSDRVESKYLAFQNKFYTKHIPFFKEFFSKKIRPSLKRNYQFRCNQQPTITPVQFECDFIPKFIVPIYINEIREYPEGDWGINIVNISLLNKFLQAPTNSWITFQFSANI